MRIEIIYTDILNNCYGYGELYNATLYILIPQKYKHNKAATSKIAHVIIRMFGIEY